jgi:hypothetical protein
MRRWWEKSLLGASLAEFAAGLFGQGHRFVHQGAERWVAGNCRVSEHLAGDLSRPLQIGHGEEPSSVSGRRPPPSRRGHSFPPPPNAALGPTLPLPGGLAEGFTGIEAFWCIVHSRSA